MPDQKGTPPPVSEQNGQKSLLKKITPYDIALSQLKGDLRYYFLLEGDYCESFRIHFEENEPLLKKSGLTALKFLEYVRESFDRFKQTHNQMPFEPMNAKSFKHVDEATAELISKFRQRFGGSR